MKTTPNQQLAIDIRDCNVLVSAAAGSGKTSVLVERIISRIMGDGAGEPVDIDRLLIMTFTNAAAAEMRSRIRDAIESRITLEKNAAAPDSERLSNLEKQSLLVHSAMITTIHGFCKSILADHFEQTGIDPNFRVADESECALLKQDALEQCMEEAYEQADESFLRAVECFSKAKDDKGLADLIIPIHGFIMADPDPEGFLKKCCENYDFEDYDDFLTSGFVRQILDGIRDDYARIKSCIEASEDIIAQYEALTPYKANIDAYMSAVTAIDAALSGTPANDFDLIRSNLAAVNPPRFGSIRDDKLDDDEREAKKEVADLRNTAKELTASVLASFPFDLRTAFGHILTAKEELGALADLELSFIRIYDAIKRDNNVIDFNDMEHMAVKILQNPDIAEIYRQHYEEIYVDEYQDSNMAQEMLVSLICRKDPGNVFQVGDVKQSIYRFRQARPDLFLEKYNTYTDDEGPGRRILLNDNFRSRTDVVDAVNEVFCRIMKASLGGIEYDDAAKLNYGATCYDKKETDAYRAELIIGIKDELPAEELTANIIAERINSMIESGLVIYDKSQDRMRPVSYRDFTVLVRSIKKYEPVFRKVFGSVGIPIAVTGREGYFSTVEVQTALAFLASVDNSLCDIELATLMRSPVGGFDDKDLAYLAAIPEKKQLYERVRAAADIGHGRKDGNEGAAEDGDAGDKTVPEIPEELRDKCSRLIKMLDDYKVMSTYTPVHDLLSHFIDNEYADYVNCMPGAGQRMANLRMLLAKAEEFGKTSFKGLYRFVRYMDQIRKYSIDDGETGITGENDDVVRIMTMHSSKGLEFPVCFLAGMEKRRNTQDESGKIVWSTKMGFGVDFTDTDRRICGPTLAKVPVCRDNRMEAIAEEMRILYVAMTRAREKLIMVGTDKEDAFDAPDKQIENSLSYLDMLKAAYPADGFEHIDISYMKESDLVLSRFTKKIEDEAAADEIYDIVNEYAEAKDRPEDRQHIRADNTLPYLSRLAFSYPYDLNPDHVAKLSVSDLKHKAIEEKRLAGEELVPDGQVLFGETEPDRYIPKFMRQEGRTKTGATFYGTAFHRIMELWDYAESDTSVENIKKYAGRMHELHRMDSDQADAVNANDVKTFLDSALAGRMKAADERGLLFREQPFVIGVDEGGEMVLVQGIIDAYFMEDDGITIVDYKTDHVSDEKMLINRYRTQLEYYGKALAQITGRPVKALCIYSTCLKREIVIN